MYGGVQRTDHSGIPLVSVIVPTYNRPELLDRALRSILGQTLRGFEIVVINDGGPDLRAVLAELQHGQALRYLVHPSNKGLAAARNTGMREARGKYIAYLDDDDIYYPDHLETLVTFLENSDYRVAYTDARRAWQEFRDGEWVTTQTDAPYSWEFDPDQLLDSNYIPVLCIAHRRSCLDEVGMMDESLPVLEDLDLWIRMSRVFEFAHIPKLTCEFSWRPQSESLSTRRVEFSDALSAIYKKYAIHRKEVQHRKSIKALEHEVGLLRGDLQSAQDQVQSLESEVEHMFEVRHWLKRKLGRTYRRVVRSG
jgi:glycosyltransferase involved in cell wall biosynthesis